MYERRNRLNNRQQIELIKFFVTGATERAAGEMAGVNRNTAAAYFIRLRRFIASHLPSYRLSGEIEADERYFGGTRKGKRGRGAARKIAVFDLLKRNGRVYTTITPDARTETLFSIIREQVEPDSIVYTDIFSAYNALDINVFHHHRINHSQKFAEQYNYINEIENFWNQTKRHLRRFNGIKPEHFYWFLKECEWCFNGNNHKQLLTVLIYLAKRAKH